MNMNTTVGLEALCSLDFHFKAVNNRFEQETFWLTVALVD